ncbi:hypothetical protein D3C84_593680 [compost metagenome]
MHPSPTFRSHAEQLAAVGSAVGVDPKKFPRRYALMRARGKVPSPIQDEPTIAERQRELRERILPEVRELAKTMYLAEAARHINVSTRILARLAEEHGFSFQPQHRRPQQELGELARQFLDQEDGDG